jgi:hypothetical protein
VDSLVLFDLVEAAGIEPAAFVRRTKRKLHYAKSDAFQDTRRNEWEPASGGTYQVSLISM